jgi:isopenicillin-N N-acyltransferase-like protein
MLTIIELSGSARQMGEAFGEACRGGIRELYDLRLAAALRFAAKKERPLSAEQVLATARQCLPSTAAYDPDGYDEFRGIDRAAGLSPEQLFALQGYTDLRDLLGFGPLPHREGCTSFIVAGDRAAGGRLLIGQTWDLQTDNMPYVCLVHREPADAPETWSLTLTGCLTLIGLNSEGIAVGNTNLQTRDVRPGVQYLSVLHRALRARSLAEAIAAIRDAPRSAAHYYYVAGPDGRAVGIECSARESVRFDVARDTFVHCNHALSAKIAALEAAAPSLSTSHRQQRLTALLNAHSGAVGIADLKRFLSDHEGGADRCICRHDWEDVSTNATVIMCPATREMHACRAQPHVGQWLSRKLALT